VDFCDVTLPLSFLPSSFPREEGEGRKEGRKGKEGKAKRKVCRNQEIFLEHLLLRK